MSAGVQKMSAERREPVVPLRPVASKARWWAWILSILVVLIVVSYFAFRSRGGDATKDAKVGKGDRELPVTVAEATTGNFPVYVDALGTVTALNTVTIRSRVDGEVMSVSYDEGEAVAKGKTLVEIDPRQYQAALQQAEGQLIKDNAALKNANADLERLTSVKETVSQQQIDAAAASVTNFNGAIKVDEATIENARVQLSYCHITAPLAGKIGLRTVDVGNIVHASDATGLATITQMDPIAVIFNLPQVNLQEVLTASRGGTLKVELLNSDKTTQLAAGTLSAIDNEIDTATGTVRIKATMNNAEGLLFPNQFVNVRLLVKTLNDVTLAPTGAVQRSPDSMFVYVVGADHAVEMRPVKSGLSEGGMTVVSAGLQPGEAVVTAGLDKLAPGMKVAAHAASEPSTTQSSNAESTTKSAHAGGRRNRP